MNDVFFLGAGFSRAVIPDMPLMEDLTKKVRTMLGDEKWEHASVNVPDGNIEHILSYLVERHPWQPEKDYYLCRALFVECSEAVREAFLSVEPHGDPAPQFPEWFQNLVSYWVKSGAAVISLNYDTLVERAAMRCTKNKALTDFYRLPLARGSSREGPSPNFPSSRETVDHATMHLMKLHGSINWYYSGGSDFPGEQVYYIEYGEGKMWPRFFADHQTLQDKVPLIVPPMASKGPFYSVQLLTSIWQQARHALARADRVFFLGYSFPVTDLPIAWFLSAAVSASGAEAYIVNVACDDDEKTKVTDRYQAALSASSWQPNGNFILPLEDEPVRQFAEWYLEPKEN